MGHWPPRRQHNRRGRHALNASLPPPELVGSPAEQATNSSDGYFVSWIENQLLKLEHAVYVPGEEEHELSRAA